MKIELLLGIIGVIILTGYNVVNAIKYGELKSLSATWYYNYESKLLPKWLFQVSLISLVVLLSYPMYLISSTKFEYILFITESIGLSMVIIFPRYRIKIQNIFHVGGALIACLSSFIWCLMIVTYAPILLFMTASICSLAMFVSPDWKSGMLFWMEMIVFYFTMFCIIFHSL